MIVIADTSPLNYLILIEQVYLLRELYGRVIIPPAVYSECMHSLAPAPVRRWISAPPHWLEVQTASHAIPLQGDLDPGETQALTLASELKADLILLDDAPARQEAARLGLRFTGVLGILGDAATIGIIHLDDALLALSTTSFFASSRLIELLRQKVISTHYSND